MHNFISFLNLRIIFFLNAILLTLCLSCTKSLEDFKEEGEGLTRSLIQELQEIRTRKDLQLSYGRLQILFTRLSDLMITAQEFQEKHHLSSLELSKENHELSELLRIELNRIFLLDGGKELIEKCQEPALQKLDAYLKRMQKKKRF